MLIPTNAYLWYFAGQEPPKFALKPEPALGNCKPYTGKPRAQVFNSRGKVIGRQSVFWLLGGLGGVGGRVCVRVRVGGWGRGGWVGEGLERPCRK